ncbi:LPO_1073/Vpar_1526 family protein [Providencia sp. PROV091]|uniref:LPO_1073/Vpar_1526 family protein n=1 Tax=Providencia sp. PROV091 TaxID=2949807 RepID=UPI00234A00D3|nr:LPO_1073/Vpar_1526 family protein [Providencia sp. PROV091]
MFDKGINSGDNSNVVKTDGNNNTTIINNFDEKFIGHIVKSMLYESMPSFQEEAKKKIIESTDEYVRDLISELVIQKTDVDTLNQKLSTPDIQYSLFESAKCFAKSPERTEKSTLLNLVVKKINELDGDHEELSYIDLAINVATKLSVKQIRCIALIHYIKDIIKLSQVNNGAYYEVDPAKNTTEEIGDDFLFPNDIKMNKQSIYDLYIELYNNQMDIVFNDDEIGPVDYSMLIALGCIIQSPFSQPTFVQNVKKRTGLDLNDSEQKAKLSIFTGKIEKTIGIENVDYVVLTTVGKQIASAYISTRIRLINF